MRNAAPHSHPSRRNHPSRRALAAAVAAALAPASAAVAADYVWQVGGPTNTWSSGAADANWLVGGTGSPVPWSDGNAAIFNAAVGETVTVLSGSFFNPTVTTVGANNGSWGFNGAGVLTGDFVKAGTGTLTFTNTLGNLFSNFTVNGGLVSVGTGTVGGVASSTADAIGYDNPVTVNAGGTLRLWVSNTATSDYQNTMTVNGGTLLSEDGVNRVAGLVTIGSTGAALQARYANKNLELNGGLAGSGPITISRLTEAAAGVAIGGPVTYTGAITVSSGSLMLGAPDGSGGSLATASSLTMASGTSLFYRRNGTAALSASFPAATTIDPTFSFDNRTPDGTGVLTFDRDLGTVATTGTFRTIGGTTVLPSGTDVIVDTLSIGSQGGAANLGRIEVGPGSTLTARFFNIGENANLSGSINQTGGTVTALAGNTNGFRIGHWSNGTNPGSSYALSGGTLDATALATNGTGAPRLVNVGWDGAGTMTVGGGTGTATLKAFGIQIDQNGDSTAYADTLTVLPNGVVEVGAGGIGGASASDTMILSGGTVRSTAAHTWSAVTTVTGGTANTIDTAGGTVTLSGAISGTGTLAKVGANTLTLASPNLAGGTLSVNAGTLAAGGTLGTLALASGTGLRVGASAADGTVGTLAASSLSATGVDLRFDLTPSDFTVGGTVNDLVTVSGAATVSGGTVTPVFRAGAITGGTYTLLSAGTLSLGTAPTVAFTGTTDPNARPTVVGPVAASGNNLVLTVAGGAKNLKWTGVNSGTWDVIGEQNWTDGAAAERFYNEDGIVFDATGAGRTAVSVTGTVNPASITVSGPTSYTLAGAGTIGGRAGLSKSGTGILTLATTNTFTGPTSITDGRVVVGAGGTAGTLGGTGAIGLSAPATLEFNRSDAVTFDRAFAADAAGTLVKSGAGTMTTSGGFQLLPTNVVVNAGTLAVTGGGFGGNRLVGAGTVTVNAGGILLIPASNAHAFGGSNAAGSQTDAFVVNGGTMTLNSEQYFAGLTLNAATVNGASDLRASTPTDWRVTGTAPSTVSTAIGTYNAMNWTVADVTGSPAADVTLSGVINTAGTGALVKAGPGTMVVSGANTFAGGATVTAGTLLVANTAGSGTGAGAVAVAAGATLGGTGTATPGAALGLSITGTLAPGLPGGGVGTLTVSSASTTAASVLTFAAGATAAFDLAAGRTADQVLLTGASANDVTFNNTVLAFTDLTGGGLANGAYTLFASATPGTYAGLTTSANGTITAGLTIGSGLGAYPGSTLTVSGNNVVLNVVPEPGSAAAAVVAGAGLLAGRRRRRLSRP